MNENDNTANAVNGSGAFDVEGNPLDAGRLWPIDQAALISGVTTRALRYCDETGLVKTARTRAAQNQTATVMNAMPLSGSFGAIRSALVGDPRFADPCGEALYGSKACADFVNEAKNIHARQIAERFAAEQDVRNQPK
mgnify:FL=1